jgi:hypothetical protein
MRILRSAICLVCCFWFLSPPFSVAQTSPGDDPNRRNLKSLLEELQQAIEEADKRMVAHPRFLEELQALVDRYQAKLREVYFYEDFADGDYTQSPTWTVKSGKFRVVPAGRLWSRVWVEQPPEASVSDEEEPLGLLLKEILRSTEKKERDKREVPKKEKAVIRSLARIDPAFEVDFSFVSESTWGSMEIVLLGGDPPVARYRLLYHAAPSKERPIEIIRVRGSREYVIESATQYPELDDGVLHRIRWIRDDEGKMRVLVDDKKILSTVEVFYRDDFAGLELVNHGGTYELGPIKILQAEKEGQL